MEMDVLDQNGHPVPSSELLNHIIGTRIADLREQCNRAVADALAADQFFCETRRFGISTHFGYAPEIYERTESGAYRYPKAVALLEFRDRINQHHITRIVDRWPSIPIKALVQRIWDDMKQETPPGGETPLWAKTEAHIPRWLRNLWPGTRGRKSASTFPARFIAAAHDALLREQRHWGCRAACEMLADRLRITTRTVQTHRKRGRMGTP
jgi:hypothetical protein